MKQFLPGDLVEVHDNIDRKDVPEPKESDSCKNAGEDYPCFGVVLSNYTDSADEIDVAVDGEQKTFSRNDLTFVARAVSNDSSTNGTQTPSREASVVSRPLDVIDQIMDDLAYWLPDHIEENPKFNLVKEGLSRKKGVITRPALRQFIRRKLKSPLFATDDGSSNAKRTLQDYANVDEGGWKKSEKQQKQSLAAFEVLPTKKRGISQVYESTAADSTQPTKQPRIDDLLRHQSVPQFPEQVKSLLRFGEVAEVLPDNNYIVAFDDGSRWCLKGYYLISSRFLSGKDPRDHNTVVFRFFLKSAEVMKGRLDASTLFAVSYHDQWTFIGKYRGNVNLRDAYGNTPLHYAAHRGHMSVIIKLLEKGAETNATNKQNRTALHIAAKRGALECVRDLVSSGHTTDLDIQDEQGNTALHVAILERRDRVVNYFINHTHVNDAIANKDGRAALHLAVVHRNDEAVKVILSRRKNSINLRETGEQNTALHLAAQKGYYDIAEILLREEWCEVDLPNKHGETPLVVAARNGHWSIVEQLLLAGANINIEDSQGDTALHISLRVMEEETNQRLDMAKIRALKAAEKRIVDQGYTGDAKRLAISCLLVQRGAQINCPNKEGITPLNIASGLKPSAQNFLQHFLPEKNAYSKKCNNCFEMPANTKFLPCGDCLYCDECAKDMKVCLKCMKAIITTVTTDTLTGTKTTTEKYQVSRNFYLPKVYKMSSEPRGTCIIINNMDFDREQSKEERKGSDLDAQRMKSLFTQLHFSVTVKTNLTALDMKSFLRKAAEPEKHRDADCLVVILLSHGNENAIEGTDGNMLDLRNEIYSLFNNTNCPTLKEKPKLFFVQACRGDKVQVPRGAKHNAETEDSTQSLAPVVVQHKPGPEWSDMFIAHSTIPEHASGRIPTKGSLFISTVFSVFRKHAATIDLASLMGEVANDMMQLELEEEYVQTPSIEQLGWTKLLFFFNTSGEV